MTGNKIGNLKSCRNPFSLWHFGLKIQKSQYLLLPLPFLVTPRQILQFHRKNAIFLSTTFSARPCIAVYYVKVKERIHWLAGYCPFHPAWKIPSKGRRKYKCQTIVEAGCMSRSSRIANKGSACRSLRSGSLDLLEVISSVRVFVSLYISLLFLRSGHRAFSTANLLFLWWFRLYVSTNLPEIPTFLK